MVRPTQPSNCPVLAPGEPVAEVGPVGPLHPSLVQGPQHPAADKDQPWARQHGPLAQVPGEHWPSLYLAGHICCGQCGHGLVVLQEAPVHLLAQGQAQGIDQEVPGLVFFLHEAASTKTQHVAQRPQQQEKLQFRPPRAGAGRVLQEEDPMRAAQQNPQ